MDPNSIITNFKPLETVLELGENLGKDLLLDPGISEVNRITVNSHWGKVKIREQHEPPKTVHLCSALYVVDLKQFRRIAAGDRLRGQYQALSQDPNSLSNLDQVSRTFLDSFAVHRSRLLQFPAYKL